MKTLNS